MSEKQNFDRRRFLGTAAITLAAGPLVMLGSASAAALTSGSSGAKKGYHAGHSSFGPLKQIDAGLLNIGYAEAGPSDGPVVILLHGWPYDIHSFVDATAILAAKGYRVIVPYSRGYGTTSFLSSETMRNAQQSAVALDVIALMDVLKIQTAIVGGFDWGGRTADVMATLWPERCKGIVSVSGYLISTPKATRCPGHPSLRSCFGISTISPPQSARPAMRNTLTSSISLSGTRLRQSGISTMPRMPAQRRLFPIPTTLTS